MTPLCNGMGDKRDVLSVSSNKLVLKILVSPDCTSGSHQRGSIKTVLVPFTGYLVKHVTAAKAGTFPSRRVLNVCAAQPVPSPHKSNFACNEFYSRVPVMKLNPLPSSFACCRTFFCVQDRSVCRLRFTGRFQSKAKSGLSY